MKDERNETMSSNGFNDTIEMFVKTFDESAYFKDKLTFKNQCVYLNDERVQWKRDKKNIRTVVAFELQMKKTEIDYDMLWMALVESAKKHREEDDCELLISPDFHNDFYEIEELIDEIINDTELSEEKNDWELYRDWKNNEAIRIVNADGETKGFDPCYDNLIGWLEHYPPLKNQIRYNEKSYRIDIWNKIYDDNTVHTIMGMLNKHFIRKFSNIKGLNEAIKGCANRHHYHPFKEYLETLTYDESRDWFNYLLTDVLHVEMWNEYGDLYSSELRKWLYACVKRIYEPGTKFDNILVLVSENQGTGKSSIWERLFTLGNESYCKIVDASQEIPTGDRFIQQCASKICINFDEIAVKSKNVNKIKTMLSQQNDEWHTLYSIADAPKNRDYIFVGTTNNTDFLKDYTSMFERRWWLIKITEDTNNGVLMNRLFDDDEMCLRDKIWAQAKHLYDERSERELYITQSSDLGKKLAELQRGYKASNNENYGEIKELMNMEFGFHNEFRWFTVDDIVKQYKHGDTWDYCQRRNNEILQNFKNDKYTPKPEDKYFTHYGRVDKWPVTMLYSILNKLDLSYTSQSLKNELKFDNVFEYKNAHIKYDKGQKVMKCFVRRIGGTGSTLKHIVDTSEDDKKINNPINDESKGADELPF